MLVLPFRIAWLSHHKFAALSTESDLLFPAT